jgi:hypothetical protein
MKTVVMFHGTRVQMKKEMMTERPQNDDGTSSESPSRGDSVTCYDTICHGPVTHIRNSCFHL